MPVLRRGNPQLARPEEWFDEKNAPDDVVFPRRGIVAAEAGDTLANLGQRPSAVLFAERVPGKADWQVGIVLEEPAARDDVVWRFELEQKGFASPQHTELPAPGVRHPEVHFIDTPRRKELEPAQVGRSDVDTHQEGT